MGISEAKQAKLAKRYAAMRGSTRGRFKTGRGFAGLRKVDRRTRKILIPDIKEDDQIELLSYLAVSFVINYFISKIFIYLYT